MRKERSKESHETLVTSSVTLEEVGRDLEGWKEALRAEYKVIDRSWSDPTLSEEEFSNR